MTLVTVKKRKPTPVLTVVSQNYCVRAQKEATLIPDYFYKVLYVGRDVDDSLTEMFDEVYRFDNEQDLNDIHGDLYHVHNTPNWLARKLVHTRSKVIFDCHDMVSFYEGKIDLDEKEAFEKSAAIIHVGQKLLDKASGMFSMVGDSHVIHSSVSEKYYNKPKKKKVGDIVYEGGFCDVGHRNYRPIFKKFVEAGYSVDLFTAHPYKPHKDKNGLYIRGYRTYKNLIEELRGYRFGFVGFNHKEADTYASYSSEFLHSAMPNKFFEYMAAGIPVIVYKADAVAEIVENNGLGVVLEKPSDIKKIDTVDYDRLVDNVLKYRKENSLEGQRDKLERIYLSVIDTENFEIRNNK